MQMPAAHCCGQLRPHSHSILRTHHTSYFGSTTCAPDTCCPRIRLRACAGPPTFTGTPLPASPHRGVARRSWCARPHCALSMNTPSTMCSLHCGPLRPLDGVRRAREGTSRARARSAPSQSRERGTARRCAGRGLRVGGARTWRACQARSASSHARPLVSLVCAIIRGSNSAGWVEHD